MLGKDDGVEVYVHCDDHGIVFNASLPLYKDAIHQKDQCVVMTMVMI